MTPEQQARSDIDKLLSKAGWLIQDAAHAHISAGPVARRNDHGCGLLT